MASRKEFNEILGRVFTDRSFGEKVLRDPQETLKSCGVSLTAHEVAQLAKLSPMDIWHVRLTLGVV